MPEKDAVQKCVKEKIDFVNIIKVSSLLCDLFAFFMMPLRIDIMYVNFIKNL